MHVRRKNVAELKKHAHFQNGSANNIVAECVQAQKKTWKTVHVRRKNVAELKKHAHFQNRGVNRVCASAEKKLRKICTCGEKRSRVKETCAFSKWQSE